MATKKKQSSNINPKDALLRLGIGSFFLANSVAAWTDASEFKELVEAKSFLTKIASSTTWVHLIGINDAAFFVLMLSGKWRKLALVWGSLWMISTIVMTGAWTTDTIEHLGIIALLTYYAHSN